MLAAPSIINFIYIEYLDRIHQILLVKNRIKLFSQVFGVRRTHPKGYDRTHVAKNGSPYTLVNLLDVLMRQKQRQAVFSRFSQDLLLHNAI